MADEFTRQMLERTFAEADAAARDYEQWQAKQQPPEPWLLEDCPAGVADRKAWWLARQRRAIEKEQQSLRQQPQQQSVEIPTLPPEVQQRWDDWCDGRINNFLAGDYEDSIAQFVVEWTNKKLTPLREEIAKLRKEIALLRTEQEHKTKGGERSGSSGLVLVRDHRHA